MDINSLLTVALVVVGIGYLLVRRMLGRLVTVKSLLLLPAILTVVGANQLTGAGPFTPVTVAFVAAGIAVSVLLGVVRGATVHLEQRGAELWMRYRPVTVALWVLNLAAKGAMVVLERMVVPDSAAASQAVMVSLGVGILAESAVVLVRAQRREGTVPWKLDDARPTPTVPAGRNR